MSDRLEEIKEELVVNVKLKIEDVNWLIQQAKRVEELEEELRYERQALINQERASDAEIERLEKRVEDLKKENDRYKQAFNALGGELE